MKRALALSVAAKVLKGYGPDKVTVEIATFDPGIALLSDDNRNKALIENLVVPGAALTPG